VVPRLVRLVWVDGVALGSARVGSLLFLSSLSLSLYSDNTDNQDTPRNRWANLVSVTSWSSANPDARALAIPAKAQAPLARASSPPPAPRSERARAPSIGRPSCAPWGIARQGPSRLASRNVAPLFERGFTLRRWRRNAMSR
jgi:hypothetical protein